MWNVYRHAPKSDRSEPSLLESWILDNDQIGTRAKTDCTRVAVCVSMTSIEHANVKRVMMMAVTWEGDDGAKLGTLLESLDHDSYYYYYYYYIIM